MKSLQINTKIENREYWFSALDLIVWKQIPEIVFHQISVFLYMNSMDELKQHWLVLKCAIYSVEIFHQNWIFIFCLFKRKSIFVESQRIDVPHKANKKKEKNSRNNDFWEFKQQTTI